MESLKSSCQPALPPASSVASLSLFDRLQLANHTCRSPLCIEEFDLSDRNFRPCPCGYQVRRWLRAQTLPRPSR